MIGRRRRPPERAQSNLVAVAVALVVVTGAAALGLALADAAFADAERPAGSRRLAVSLSERMVAADAPAAERANVLNASDVDALDAAAVRAAFPVVGDHPFRVRLGGRTLAERGDPGGGETVRRIVLVERRTAVTRTPALSGGSAATTLPRRTPRVRLRIDPPNGTVVRAVRASDRVVLRDPDGLEGSFSITVSRWETVRLAFAADDALPRGSVEVTYYPAATRKATLEVTVGA